MSGNWKNVEKKHIIKAIQIYNEEGIMAYSKNTFLIYNNGRYPAKHIRALAYEVAFGVIAVKSTFSGGKETAQFFERLGFEVDYNGKDRNTVITDETNKPKEKDKKSRRCLGVVEQKNALQLHLNRYFNGDVVSEKTYDWMKTPHLKEPSIEYKKLINSLREYRGNQNIGKSNYKLHCDFVCESQKVIIEYDERQHFSKARQISLDNYPDKIVLYFDKNSWMDSCDKINAKDNTPPNRDEVRALYDSVRDIEASKNGYQLIRIKHGDYDWNFEDGQQYIDQILKQYKKEQGLYSINTSQNSLKKYDWRSLDIELQRIRLLYLKWLFHFNPIQCDALETCKYNNKVYIFDSPYGRSFSLSPAGIGNVYAGGGKGTLKLNHGSYDANNKLLRETDNIKLSLDRKVKQLKSTIESFVMDENYPLVWEYLQNFWWLRLGLHEFVFDVQFSSESLPTNDIREYILASIYNKIDLSKEIPSIFTDEQIIHSLRYKFSWNRYGVCSYDCGPLAFGREGFVPYKVAAHQIKKYFNENKIEFTKLSSINQKRSFAANSLSNLYDFQILYHEKPLGFYTHNDFKKNKEKLKLKITEVENILNKIATTEKLNLD